MKKILAITALLITFYSAQAQELAWTNNLNQAVETSIKTKKPILLFFTGSDWCGWCKRLQNEVFLKPEFAKWAKENVILVEIDFPRMTSLSEDVQAQNNQLQQIFNVQGYPTIWIVNPTKTEERTNLEQLGSTGYVAGGPNAWLSVANGILKKDGVKSAPEQGK